MFIRGTQVVLHMCQQFCGINAVFYYSTDFFRGVIADPLLGSTLVAAVNVLATIFATVLMDQVPRSPQDPPPPPPPHPLAPWNPHKGDHE